MTKLLENYVAGRWQAGSGKGTTLHNPVTGEALVRIDNQAIDLAEGFAFAREQGGKALREMTYQQRGQMLADVVAVLRGNRDAYYDISTANSGTVKNDSAVDIEGGIFTLSYYAKLGAKLGDKPYLMDGEASLLGQDSSFQSQHILTPRRGVALFINAFNFPAWGLWEKAAPALLSGIPVIVKPASPTAWLTQQMVNDVVSAGVIPEGALSVICGSSAGLLDQLQTADVLSFTGSADTAEKIRSHPAVTRHSVRVNIEADSINSALLLPDEEADSEAFTLLVKEAVREMTVKSGQKCTAIRRIFVHKEHYAALAKAISTKLANIRVGNPKDETVRMGSLVSRQQYDAICTGLKQLKTCTEVLYDGNQHPFQDIDNTVACCLAPTLLGTEQPEHADLVHNMEVFGPVATLIAYQDMPHAVSMIRQGQGSLVTSLYGSDPVNLAQTASELADSNGRVHVISPEVGSLHTGHGNVMPQSLHGGPGRAGGGEELGGLRALNFYHQRSAIQASSAVLENL